MLSPARRCSRLVRLLTVLWAVARSEATPSQPSGNIDTAFDPQQVLGVIANEVTAKMQPLISQFVSRMDALDSRLASVDSRLTSVNNRLDGMETRLTALGLKQDSFAGSLDGHSSRMGSTETKLDQLVSQVDQLASRMESAEAERSDRLDTVSSRLDGLSSRLYWLTNRTESLHHPLPRDCSELPEGAQSGIYLLKLDLDPSQSPVSAYCDLKTDGGGWTVIQRRRDTEPRQNFNRNWTDYREGFGDLHAEFWWGLRSLWGLTGTADRQYELHVNLADLDGESRQAAYREFRVASEADGYRLTVSGYQGNAGDSLQKHNGKKFSTIDRDQDEAETSSCARSYKGGWWFYSCYKSFLNGVYLSGEQEKRGGGVNWNGWRGDRYSLKDAEMKIRPVNTD